LIVQPYGRPKKKPAKAGFFFGLDNSLDKKRPSSEGPFSRESQAARSDSFFPRRFTRRVS